MGFMEDNCDCQLGYVLFIIVDKTTMYIHTLDKTDRVWAPFPVSITDCSAARVSQLPCSLCMAMHEADNA